VIFHMPEAKARTEPELKNAERGTPLSGGGEGARISSRLQEVMITVCLDQREKDRKKTRTGTGGRSPTDPILETLRQIRRLLISAPFRGQR